jgi:hypothetical protein
LRPEGRSYASRPNILDKSEASRVVIVKRKNGGAETPPITTFCACGSLRAYLPGMSRAMLAVHFRQTAISVIRDRSFD